MLTVKQQEYINKLICQSIKKNKYQNIKNKYINSIIETYNLELQMDDNKVNLEDITEILIPKFDNSELKSNGITFTPIKMVKYLFDEFTDEPSKLLNLKIADIAVGNGAFFIGLIILLKEKGINFSVVDFIENNCFGYDNRKENIEILYLIFNLVSLYYGENIEKITPNIRVTDSLVYFKKNNQSMFDLVIGNPPYVKQQNIDIDYREFLLDNFETINSNYNLYYAFIETSLSIIRPNGKAILLIPNYLLKIKSATTLRNYLIQGGYISRIVDFRENKMFNNIDTYSMIIELKNNSLEKQYKIVENERSFSELLNKKWKILLDNQITKNSINLVNEKESKLIDKVSGQLYTLDISTGIATQKDKLYLIDQYDDSLTKYYKIYNGKKYPIEKELIVKLYKGSGQKEFDIKYNYIIYPYVIKDNQNAELIPIEVLRTEYPDAYRYFIDAKEELLTRSGVKDDHEWYKYGRSQSLTKFEPKILFPTNTLKPNFNLIKDRGLFHNGYAIFGLLHKETNIKDLEVITAILNSELIGKFMYLTSYFIGGGYLSYQKKYIQKVTIPPLTDDIKEKILIYKSKNLANELDRYIYRIYNLDHNDYTENINEFLE